MKPEIERRGLRINFIQGLVMGSLTSMLGSQIKNLLQNTIQHRTGKFLKSQFREHCTRMIKDFIINQLKGKFAEYLTDFIMTYVESNIDSILDSKTTTGIAEKLTNNIIRGLGTYLFKTDK